MAEDNFQNQAYLDYAAFDSYLNEATTFNSATNTMAHETFDIIRNPVYPDSITCDSYFDGPMALNTVADGIIASTNFDIIPSQVCPCDSYFEPMTLNTEAGNEVFPEYIACDSDGDEPSILNEVFPEYIACDSDGDEPSTLNEVFPDYISCDSDGDEPSILNEVFPEYITCDSDGDEPLTLNLATSTVVDDTFDIQNPIFSDYPHLDEPTTREFQKWKESWDEKMLLVHWKREGKDWEDITKSFKKMKTRSGNTRKSMLQRADSEVSLIPCWEAECKS
jgi:hypothetical protein